MADKTGIEWTDATWNPIAGCSLVSPGCTNCYAMRQGARIVAMAEGAGKATHYAGTVRQVKDAPVWTGTVNVAPDATFLQPLKWRRPRRIFVNSMSDLFHEAVPDAVIDRVFAVMALTPQHTYQVLTKRPERMRKYCIDLNTPSQVAQAKVDVADTAAGQGIFKARAAARKAGVKNMGNPHVSWPLPNVWLGLSVEDQRRADERIPILLDTPAVLRWVSAEPLLGPVDIAKYMHDSICQAADGAVCTCSDLREAHINWVVAGGESGPNARPMHPDWARSIRDQCAAAGVPFLFKQWGEWAPHYGRYMSLRYRAQAFHSPPNGWEARGAPVGWHNARAIPEEIDGELPDVIRIGKHAAGRVLDGVLWDQYPEARI